MVELRSNDGDAFKNFDHAKYKICELKDWKFVHFKNGWVMIKNGDALKNEKKMDFLQIVKSANFWQSRWN